MTWLEVPSLDLYCLGNDLKLDLIKNLLMNLMRMEFIFFQKIPYIVLYVFRQAV